MRLSAPGRRPGITLIEILVATVIFLIAVVAIMQLMSLTTDQALDVQFRSRAARLCQSKLNEYVAGVEAVGSAGGSASGTFEEDDEWQWSADVQAESSAANLYRVSVTVSRDTPTRGHIEVSMTQFVFDPTQRGQIVASPPPAVSSGTTGGSGTGMTGGSGGTGTAGGSGGTGMSGGSGGAGMSGGAGAKGGSGASGGSGGTGAGGGGGGMRGGGKS